MNKNELSDFELDAIVGGSIDYNPAAPGAVNGRIGINKNLTHKYDSIDAVRTYVSAHYYDKNWSSVAERDNYLFQGLIDAGIIY